MNFITDPIYVLAILCLIVILAVRASKTKFGKRFGAGNNCHRKSSQYRWWDDSHCIGRILWSQKTGITGYFSGLIGQCFGDLFRLLCDLYIMTWWKYVFQSHSLDANSKAQFLQIQDLLTNFSGTFFIKASGNKTSEAWHQQVTVSPDFDKLPQAFVSPHKGHLDGSIFRSTLIILLCFCFRLLFPATWV